MNAIDKIVRVLTWCLMGLYALVLNGFCFYAYGDETKNGTVTQGPLLKQSIDSHQHVPQKWIRVNARRFSFLVPGDIKSEDVQGIDSYVGRSKNTYMQLEFGYGMYSFNLDDFKGRADYQEVMADIGGKRAKVATFSKMQNASEEYLRRGWFSFGGAGAYFGDVHDGNKLGVVVYCKNSADLDVAKKIVYSIKFSGR